jgi:hypothetical protein
MHVSVAGMALLCVALSGCWVFDELDSGMEKMERYSSAKKPAEAAPEAPAPAAKGPRASEYFASQKNARTFTKGQLSGDIVSCQVNGATQFMKQDECLRRGGVPKS